MVVSSAQPRAGKRVTPHSNDTGWAACKDTVETGFGRARMYHMFEQGCSRNRDSMNQLLPDKLPKAQWLTRKQTCTLTLTGVQVKCGLADVRWVWLGVSDSGCGLTGLGIRLQAGFRPVSGAFILGIKLKGQQLPWESSSTSRSRGHEAKLEHTADLSLLLGSHCRTPCQREPHDQARRLWVREASAEMVKTEELGWREDNDRYMSSEGLCGSLHL